MKIEKCPFCGGEADIEEIPGSPFTNEPYMWAVGCKDCNIGWYEETKEEAIAAWNRRTDHIRDTTKMVSNADRIRSMSDEELARWLVDATVCERVCDEDEYCHGNECVKRVTDWLKQPEKGENNA